MPYTTFDYISHIFIDAIGIKDKFRTDMQSAGNLVQNFWEVAKNIALHDSNDYRYVTFSDSLLIYMSKDRQIRGMDLVHWMNKMVFHFKERVGLEFYAIANDGQEFKPSLIHEITAVKVHELHKPKYIHIAGFGGEFANLFIAEERIRKLRKKGTIQANAKIYIHELNRPI